MTKHHGGLIISALATKMASGSGKTTITAALLAALKHRHAHAPQSYKVGPDYIDGKIHGRISKRPCFNLDSFAMAGDKIITLLNQSTVGEPRIIEGVMGMFDGARAASHNGSGSTAELAEKFGFAMLLVVRGDEPAAEIARMVISIEKKYRLMAVVVNDIGKKIDKGVGNKIDKGDVKGAVAGAVAIDNRGGAVDKKIWQDAWQTNGLATPLIFLPASDFSLPHRHLGLHQAEEWHEQDWQAIEKNLLQMANDFQTMAGDELWQKILSASMVDSSIAENNSPPIIVRQENHHLAVARDAAFSFIYPHHLFFWQQKGIEISFFSPLNDESPAGIGRATMGGEATGQETKINRDGKNGNTTTAIFLPGGYPELHLPQLATAKNFFTAMQTCNNIIYGECGGFMMLGQKMIDKDGVAFPALGLLSHGSSFAEPKLHLGYRYLDHQHHNLSAPQQNFFHRLFDDGAFGHEFHYCKQQGGDNATPLFTAQDSTRQTTNPHGQVANNVMGSFLHLL